MPEKRTIVLIQEVPSVRIAKIGKGLIRAGDFNIVICYLKTVSQYPTEKVFTQKFCYDFIPWISGLPFETIKGVIHNRLDLFDRERLLKYIRNLKNLYLVHAISPPPKLCRWVIESEVCTTVFDQYDLLAQSYGKDRVRSKDLKDELFCIENADGMVHKGPAEELEFYYKEFRVSPASDFTFPDPCDEDLFVPPAKKISSISKEVHFVYVGGISRDAGYDLIKVGEMLSRQGIHLHIYPAPNTSPSVLKEYLKHQKENTMLHLHAPVAYLDLPSEISKYHFGIYLFPPSDDENFMRKMRTASGNKIPSYWEAGLPVIIAKDLEYSANIVKEYDGGFVIKIEELENIRELIGQIDYEEMSKKVFSARERFSLSKKILELISFYEKLGSI